LPRKEKRLRRPLDARERRTEEGEKKGTPSILADEPGRKGKGNPADVYIPTKIAKKKKRGGEKRQTYLFGGCPKEKGPVLSTERKGQGGKKKKKRGNRPSKPGTGTRPLTPAEEK